MDKIYIGEGRDVMARLARLQEELDRANVEIARLKALPENLIILTHDEHEKARKAAAGLYSFPEAGPGRWHLPRIKNAFEAAWIMGPIRDLRRQSDRVRLLNRRLVREVAQYGQKISQGSANSWSVYFQPEVVERAADTLRGSPDNAS